MKQKTPNIWGALQHFTVSRELFYGMVSVISGKGLFQNIFYNFSEHSGMLINVLIQRCS